MATREFNIDEVIAGAEIIQRSGGSAKFVAYTPEAGEETVTWLDEAGFLQLSYATGGYYSVEHEVSKRDLFILEPDRTTLKKIIQSKAGTKFREQKPFEFWYDTSWDDIKHARENFPDETYREVLVVS